MATTNLTSKQITTWQKNVDTAISTKLINSLKNTFNDAAELASITSSGEDENDLNYRFNDLKKVMNQSSLQLTKFMNAFDADLTKYISSVKSAESALEESVRKTIDQFAEAANKIAKLSM